MKRTNLFLVATATLAFLCSSPRPAQAGPCLMYRGEVNVGGTDYYVYREHPSQRVGNHHFFDIRFTNGRLDNSQKIKLRKKAECVKEGPSAKEIGRQIEVRVVAALKNDVAEAIKSQGQTQAAELEQLREQQAALLAALQGILTAMDARLARLEEPEVGD